ncbi:hypothetical protein KCU83_g6876, partial [Aureobasidium melanogenum]
MPEILQRASQDGRDLELLDSVTGAVAACANISTKLDTASRTTAACLSGPLRRVISGFNSMSQSYTTAKGLLEHPHRVWCQNVSLSIRFTQERCQQIATEIAIVLRNHGEWDVLAVNGSYRRLNMLSKNLEMLKAHHDLLFRILDLVPVLLRKPAEHESPDSIIMPDYPEEDSDDEISSAEWANHEALQERYRIAYVAAQEMDRWFGEYTSSFDTVQQTLRSMKGRLKELLDYQVSGGFFHAQGFALSALEELPDSEDDTSTRSTMGIMTPTEDWSDLGSDTTEIVRAPAITKHSLQLCGYATASFLRLVDDTYQDMIQWGRTVVVEERVQRLHKAYAELVVHLLHGLDAPVPFQDYPARSASVPIEITRDTLLWCVQETKKFLDRNNATERSFIDLPGATPVDVADIEAMHKASGCLAQRLCYGLLAPIPFQDDRLTPGPVPVASTAPASHPASEASNSVMPEDQKEQVHADKVLEAIIDSMESNPTEKDIMKLVFHWTTLNECNGFESTDVMKLD